MLTIGSLTPWILAEAIEKFAPHLWGKLWSPMGPLLWNSTGYRLYLLVAIPMAIGIILALPFVLVCQRWEKEIVRYTRWKNCRCIHCNYDLRAHAPGDNCPECGTPIPPKTATMESKESS
jgi:hypothetical protein